MRVFMDFEASSLGKHSYPVEIAWLFEDGRARSFLIRPEAHWTDWSAEAEAIHGLSRAQLQAEGEPAGVIVDEMLATLSGKDLYASSPSWDGKWLSVLLRAAGRARHALRLRKSDDAFVDAASAILGSSASPAEILSLVEGVIARTKPQDLVHRALPDARLELDRFNRVCLEARALSRQRRPSS